MEEIFGVMLLLGCGFISGIFLAIIVGKIEENKEDEKLVETVSRNTIDIDDLSSRVVKLEYRSHSPQEISNYIDKRIEETIKEKSNKKDLKDMTNKELKKQKEEYVYNIVKIDSILQERIRRFETSDEK